MTYTITSGVEDVVEATHVLYTDIAARQFVIDYYDFTPETLDELFIDGAVTFTTGFDAVEWVRLTVTE